MQITGEEFGIIMLKSFIDKRYNINKLPRSVQGSKCVIK